MPSRFFSSEGKTSGCFLEEVVDYLDHYHHPIIFDFAKEDRRGWEIHQTVNHFIFDVLFTVFDGD